ncbi:MAG: crossover junction endodeoxyribonuclease RuvC [Candidatus Muirbacterium halophilum]|nr:crossover junction endodeoxyribonuclease RuvC [Candidatus Muirbacterium halophilum]MCK9475055.1 crossover junction endodeoxyribonuclease RuvC [Candidatus Muirbacterium halophilum]
MRVLGIDPGTAIVGFSVIEKKKDSYCVITYGQITTSKENTKEVRLKEIFDNIQFIINKYSPDVLAIEKLFFFKNATTVMAVSEARGVIILAGVLAGLKISEYTPLEIKQAITGYGRASKKDIQEMVTKLLNLECVPKPDDVADAIAISITHINTLSL